MYTKEMQTGRKKKKEKAKGFGSKPCAWNNKTTSKKPKVKKYDIVDDKYSKWLGTQVCCISGIRAERGIGVNNIHCHHIHGRTPRRNDYKQVPLMGWLHSWGGKSYHDNTKADFIKKNMIMTDDIIAYFEDLASYYNELYIEQGGVINKDNESF